MMLNKLKVEIVATDDHTLIYPTVKFNDLPAVEEEHNSGDTMSYIINLPTNSSSSNRILVWVTDEAGNRADFGTDEFVFELATGMTIDVKAPEISLIGGDVVLPLNGNYVEPGAVVYDDMDGSTLTPDISGSIDVTQVGTYTLTYTVADLAGNEGNTLSRTISVVDNIDPIIASNLVNQDVSGSEFVFSATASDNDDVSSFVVRLNGNVISDTDDIFTEILLEGENTITLVAADNSGNITSESYTVTFVRPLSGQPIIIPSTKAPTNQPILVSITYPDQAVEKLYRFAGDSDWIVYTQPISTTSGSVTIEAVTKETVDSERSDIVSLIINNSDATL
jgi:hypothetical protein